jgi:hypothetical protein
MGVREESSCTILLTPGISCRCSATPAAAPPKASTDGNSLSNTSCCATDQLCWLLRLGQRGKKKKEKMAYVEAIGETCSDLFPEVVVVLRLGVGGGTVALQSLHMPIEHVHRTLLLAGAV